MLIWTLPCQKVISLLLAATPTRFVSEPSEIVPVGSLCSSDNARAGTRRSSSPGIVSESGKFRIAMRYESVATMRIVPSTRDTRTPVSSGPTVVV